MGFLAVVVLAFLDADFCSAFTFAIVRRHEVLLSRTTLASIASTLLEIALGVYNDFFVHLICGQV